jgi:hypothetical protein
VSPPSPPTLCGHPRRCATIPGTAAPSSAPWEPGTTRHHHARCCASCGLPSAEPSSQRTDSDRTGSPHAATLEAAPGWVQDLPRHPPGARFTRTTVNFTTLCAMLPYVALRTVRHDRLPLAYKRKRRSPGRGGRRIAAHLHFSAFTTILALRLNQTSGTWRLPLLSRLACSSPLQELQCNAIQRPERTPAGCTAHGRNQDKPVSLCCLAPPSRDRSQCSY